MDKNLVKKVAEVKHITETQSDLELFSKVTGLIYATEDMMNDENADWYVPAGAFIPSDSEMVAGHVGEEVTDENKQYDVDNDGDIDEDDVTAAKEAEANSKIEVNEDDYPIDDTPVVFTYLRGENNSSWGDNTNPDNVTDNDDWTVSITNMPAYIVYEASKETNLSGIKIQLGSDMSSGNHGVPGNWTLEGSNDDTTWTNIITMEANAETNEIAADYDEHNESSTLSELNLKEYNISISDTNKYKYFKFSIISKYGGNWGTCQLNKLQLY